MTAKPGAGSREPFRIHRGRVAPLRRNHVDIPVVLMERE